MDKTPNQEQLTEWLLNYISTVTGRPREEIPPDAPFESYGLDSAELVILAAVMEEDFGIEIEPSWFFDNPDLNSILACLKQQLPQAPQVS